MVVKKIVLHLILYVSSIGTIAGIWTAERGQAWSDGLVQTSGGAPQVFIARQRSEFKDALVSNITLRLDAQSIPYEVVDISSLKKLDEQDYKAVVIIQYVKAGRINGKVRRYLDTTADMDKVVLVTTSGSGNTMTGKWDIDTISSASEMSDIDKVTRTVLSRLEAILNVRLVT
jgi:hypothetical protein